MGGSRTTPVWRTAGYRTAAAALAALAALAAALPATATARRPQGINVNQSQREIDWKLVARKSRMEFAYVRASEGLEGKDRYYDKNIHRARQAGLKVGAFHRMYPQAGGRRSEKRDALKEARVFLKSVGRVRRVDMIPVLGVDPPFGGLSGDRLIRWIDIWMGKVRRKLKVVAGIYTSQAIWDASLDGTKYFARRGHRLWIASRELAKPLVPAHDWDRRGWSIWQRGIGDVQGISRPVNKNVGTYRSLRRLSVAENRPGELETGRLKPRRRGERGHGGD
jgi:lysozyme